MFITGLTVVVISLLVSAGGGQDLRVSPDDLELRTFLTTAYPELAGRAIQIETKGRGGVRVSEVAVTGGPGSADTPLLDAQVQFTAQHTVRAFDARGVLVKDADNGKLARAVKDARRGGRDVDAEIMGRALGFGPDRKAAILAHLEDLHLDDHLGAISVRSARPIRPQDDDRYGFYWQVEIESVRAGDGPKRYVLVLEPFEGHLVSLRER
jgi:hypothetical protein